MLRYSSALYRSHQTIPEVRSCSGVSTFLIMSWYLVQRPPSTTGLALIQASTSLIGTVVSHFGVVYVMYYNHCKHLR